MKQKTGLQKIGSGAMLAFFAGWALLSAGAVVHAGESVKLKQNDATFYSDFFDQNVYNEGVNLLDMGRWGRKFSGKALPSKNVNVFDEVPDSSFFTNRQGRERLSSEALEKGYQETSGPDQSRPLQVMAAEQRGIYPRFWVQDAKGEAYLLEFDPVGKFELVTAAQVIASRFYHALGYSVPQMTVVFIKHGQFRADPAATTWEDTGFKKALSQERLEEYLMVLPQNTEGSYRASACKVPKGDFYGSFSFESRRKEDPADLVNHRDLREIRALGLFASWLNHYDLRESDTLDLWVSGAGGAGLKHYLGGFDGALGATREGPKAPMLGYEYMVDYGETFKTLLALGFREKPWQKKWREAGERVQGSPAVGYFTNALFDPSQYKTLFPYEAFRLVTRADGFWAAKLLKSFSDDDIRAMVKAGKYTDAKDAETIAKILIERRDMIARFWILRASPLDNFSFSDAKLSFQDLAVEYGFAPREGTTYRVEVSAPGSDQKTVSEVKEPVVNVAPIPTGGETRISIRVVRAASKEVSPAVTVLLNAAGIQGIQRED
jgi:hypothetical protein